MTIKKVRPADPVKGIPLVSSTEAPADGTLVLWTPPGSPDARITAQNFLRAYSMGGQTLALTEIGASEEFEILWNARLGRLAKVVLTDNAELQPPSNAVEFDSFVLLVSQDATGGRGLTFHSDFWVPADGIDPVTQTANALDIITFLAFLDGAEMKFLVVGHQQDFVPQP